ncbi:MAG: class I SAM-dependent methyltransferase [Candidatus Micrarchaeota archaeon]
MRSDKSNANRARGTSEFDRHAEEKYYEKIRKNYPPALEIERKIFSFLSRAKPRVVLDAGCGEGHFIKWAAKKLPGAKFIGVDFSKGMCTRARENTANLKNVKIINADITRMPINSGSVDFVVSFDVYEHLPLEKRRGFFAEIHRVLKPRGCGALTTPNKFSWNVFLHPRTFLKVFFDEHGSESEWSHWESGTGIREKMAAAGLRVLRCETYPLLEPNVRERRIAWLLKLLSGSRFGVKQIFFYEKK